MPKHMNRKDENYKHWAIQAAKDLHYGEDVIKELKAAKTDDEIDRIMRNARIGGE